MSALRFAFVTAASAVCLAAEALNPAFSQKSVPFEKEPRVQSRMLALTRNFFSSQIRNPRYTGVGPHHHPVIEQADALAEVDPAVAFGSSDIGRQVIATDELHAAVGNVVMGILGADEIVILHLQPVLFPAAGFADDVQKRQMAFRAIRKMYFVHLESLLVSLGDDVR